MQYSLLFYQTPEVFAEREDPEKHKAFHAAFVPYMKAMHDAGIVVAGAGLQKPDTATSLRPGDGGHRVQDGPFADTKEQLAGFFIIDVPDMDAALKWAARYPASPGFGVEVRPCLPPADHEAVLRMMAES
ncbi:YciI family protein [Mesorhizobium sp. LHD-90]|uniref:YciI family protein n=1 Tax=Mesorhizobium sp. LHD-90 TaxID=3071414 RepID=UPI0027DFABF3|nr:YciI family protein [Mesorhizobium sp. LHD-90]MDQ6436737.1 YciI family protein [Mesorhizobium sp. LHD-90]